MNARFVTLVAVVSLAALTGCTGMGNGFCSGVGAPCGAACAAAATPAYDYAPAMEAGCGCGTDSYSGYAGGVVTDGYSNGIGSYNDYGYQGGWQSSQGVPQPGQYVDGGYVVPNGPGTNMAPAPQLPQPANN
ncbi:hypothetical protein Poly24_37800 [Rosistilla carotiformis]|uniref:Lipoprotein n=1 Tax=Rosistilla carotiformis TaxID=2528017 RepID=A0A518JX01_9BACT|nr:hypothetical protein [Rosistilla carotiformis]QDV70061.1 hypothetical protein Poly24_37800 [Rosistilla carotiformis]